MENYTLDKNQFKIIQDSNPVECIVFTDLKDIFSELNRNLSTYNSIGLECILNEPLQFKPLQKSKIIIKNENFTETLSTAWNIICPHEFNDNKIKENVSIIIHTINKK